MYRKQPMHKNSFKINTSTTGESIEAKLRRMKKTNEPIKDVSEIIYTERKDGVQPQYDIRTDKMELAINVRDKQAESKRLQRSKGATKLEEKFDSEKGGETKQNNNDGGAEPVQAT